VKILLRKMEKRLSKKPLNPIKSSIEKGLDEYARVIELKTSTNKFEAFFCVLGPKLPSDL
jgi:hypothetical protein